MYIELVRRLYITSRNVDVRFWKQYNIGINAYMDGDWDIAEGAMKLASGYKPGDGPTIQILS